MRTYTYVDNSNVYIEGKKVSAVRKGLARDVDEATERHLYDRDWQIDYGRLHALVCGKQKPSGSAKLWGSLPPSDSFWQTVQEEGFEVVTFERSPSGEKKVDVALASQMTKDAYTELSQDKENCQIVLVSGDKDYVPVVADLTQNGFHVTVVFWDHAAQELKDAASKFVSLDPYFEELTWKDDD